MAIDQVLQAQTWPTNHSPARDLEVYPRTIRRDATFMRDQLLAPIAFDRGRRGYGYTEATEQLPFLRLTEGVHGEPPRFGRNFSHWKSDRIRWKMVNTRHVGRALTPERCYDAVADAMSLASLVQIDVSGSSR